MKNNVNHTNGDLNLKVDHLAEAVDALARSVKTGFDENSDQFKIVNGRIMTLCR